jgi:hypothetical protein
MSYWGPLKVSNVSVRELPDGRVQLFVRDHTWSQLSYCDSGRYDATNWNAMRTDTEMGQWCSKNLTLAVYVGGVFDVCGNGNTLTFFNMEDAEKFMEKWTKHNHDEY